MISLVLKITVYIKKLRLLRPFYSELTAPVRANKKPGFSCSFGRSV